jgi:GNAT superfamily N-acetyltransferase
MGLPDIEIRRAESRDSDQIWPLVQDFALSYEPEPAPFERSMTELLERPDTLLLVAEQGKTTIVGYLLASYHGTFLANGPVAWIEEVMVSESTRRQGVGSSLMSAAEAWAEAVPTAYVALASRRAGDFYLKTGYEDSATFFRKSFVPPVRQ